MNPPRVWPVFLAFALAFFLILVVSGLIVVIQAQATGRAIGQAALDVSDLSTGVVVAAVVLGLVTLLFSRPLSAQRLRLGPTRRGPKLVLAGVVGTLALGQILDSSVRLLGFYQSSALERFDQALAGVRGSQLFWALLLVGPVAGFMEELFFRGFMQTRLAQRWRRWPAIVAASTCFGLLHLEPVHVVVAALLGLWLGFVTEQAGSIRPAVLGHVVNNSVAVLLTAAGPIDLGPVPIITVGIIAIVLLVFCARYIRAPISPATPHPSQSSAQAAGQVV